ncbi:hypothetical protein SDC9_102975 [bioreactor metagenome]|uniref:Uncharacterized protein n=1 Tax=bioreactor metagenome TaxID=1076179 RepID=A0A645AZ43_9ZZZZ
MKINGGVVVLGGVLHDGKAQACAAGFLGMAFVHPVKALEDPELMLYRDSDAGVGDGKGNAAGVPGYGNVHAALIHVVLDGVEAEVIDNLPQEPSDPAHRGAAVDLHRHSPRFGLRREGFQRVPGKDLEVHIFHGHFNALVQLGQADNIADEGDQAACLGADMPHEAGHVFGLHQAVFNELRRAQNRLQRGFELVRHVGRELPALLFGQRLFGDVEGEDDDARDDPSRENGTRVNLVLPAPEFHHGLVVFSRLGRPHKLLHGEAAVHNQHIAPHAAGVHAEEPRGGGIDA